MFDTLSKIRYSSNKVFKSFFSKYYKLDKNMIWKKVENINENPGPENMLLVNGLKFIRKNKHYQEGARRYFGGGNKTG